MKKALPLSYIELSKANLIHNIKQFRRIVKQGTNIAAVIKANAYGHGDVEVVRALSSYVDYFQINSFEELEKIRPATKKPILLLGYVAKNDIASAIKLGCIFGIFDTKHLLAINDVAVKLKVKQKVHISIDAHLGREGLILSDIPLFLKDVKKMKNIVIDGVYAHFANIEDTTDFSHAQKQIMAFENAVTLFKENGYKNIKTHISATSGVLAYEKWSGRHAIVRVGLGLYGMWPSETLKKSWEKKIPLKFSLRWITHIASVKELAIGESIGYGLTYVTKKKTTIAVIPQGYSNGLPRLASSNGYVLIRGKKVPILGRVAMNMFVVDVTAIKGAKSDDEVVILGSQKGETITSEDWASKTHTINYEVTTRISPLLPRIVV